MHFIRHFKYITVLLLKLYIDSNITQMNIHYKLFNRKKFDCNNKEKKMFHPHPIPPVAGERAGVTRVGELDLTLTNYNVSPLGSTIELTPLLGKQVRETELTLRLLVCHKIA